MVASVERLAQAERAKRSSWYSKVYSSTQANSGFEEQDEWLAAYAVRDLLPDHAAASCGKYFGGPCCELRRKDGRAFLVGLSACKSTWVCPRCSAFLARKRRKLLDSLVRGAIAIDVRVFMVTFTFSHRAGDDLSRILTAASEALKALRSGRFSMQLRSRFAPLGFARGTEVTCGSNGWHPHYHELWFMPKWVDVAEFRAFLKDAWVAALAKQGLEASAERGCDVVEADAQIAAYVAKFGRQPRWSAGAETAGGRRKLARGKGRTPWQLLADAAAGDTAAAGLFREYAAAFSGKAQLYVSPGLYAALGVAEDRRDFEALLADDDAERRVSSELVCTVTAAQWLAVWECRAVGMLLRAAVVGPDAAAAVLADCVGFAISRGYFLNG